MKKIFSTPSRLLKAILIVSLTVGLVSLKTAIAQTQNGIWSIPSKYLNHTGLVPYNLPSPGTNPALHYTAQVATHVHNAMQDAQGNLLFFIIDEKIYDKDGYLLDKLEYSAPVKGSAEIAIAPDPGNCQRYYIISSGEDRQACWGVLDLSLNSPYNTNKQGKLLPGSINTMRAFKELAPEIDYDLGVSNSNLKHGASSFAVSKLRSDGSRFLFVSNGVNIFKFVIDANGLSYTNYKIPTYSPGPDYQRYIRAEMELVELGDPNGVFYRLAAPYRLSDNTTTTPAIFAVDLDINGNALSAQVLQLDPNPIGQGNTEPRDIHGVEFSPKGNILYITRSVQNTSSVFAIQYFDFNNPTTYFVPYQGGATPNPAYRFSDFQNSQIEFGRDNKLYFITHNRLATITNPGNPSGSTWTDNVITGLNNHLSSEEAYPSPMEQAYILPDQIDGMDYTEHFFANTACCIINRGYNASSFTAPSTATWSPGLMNNPFASVSGEVYIEKELIIPAGKTVTINNMTFRFAPGAKVVVERAAYYGQTGGHLILNNTVFTVDERCSSEQMWLGVQVYGYNLYTQQPAATSMQGKLTLNSGAIIEHALKGAVASKYNSTQNYPFYHTTEDINYSGGIIKAYLATFKNNEIDIELKNYIALNGSNNESTFTRCNFITNGALNDPGKIPLYHIYLQAVKGIQIHGNTFKNETPTEFDWNERGYGIYSQGGGFSALRNCNNYNNCTQSYPNVFQNLTMGIYAVNLTTALYTEIDRCNFFNNFYGTGLANTQSVHVTRNNYQVYRSKSPNIEIPTYGLALLFSTEYEVEENSFKEFNSPGISQGGNTYGIIVVNSGEDYNYIYKNSFRDLKVGCQAQQINGPEVNIGEDPPTGGLKILCNTFKNAINYADIAITSGSVSYHQGVCDAGNPVSEYSLAGNKFSRPHNGNGTNPEWDLYHYYQSPSSIIPIRYNHHYDLITTPLDYYNPTNFAPAPCANGLAGYWYFNEATSCPSQIAVEGRGVVGLPEQLLAEIDAWKEFIESESFQTLENDSDSENSYVLDEYIAEREQLINEYIALIMGNSNTAESCAAIIDLLQNEEGIHRKYQLFELYLAIGDFTSASSVRNEIAGLVEYDNSIRLMDMKLNANQNFITYLSTLNSTPSISDDLSTENANNVIATLQEIASDESDPVNAGKALAYLSIALDTIYPVVIEDIIWFNSISEMPLHDEDASSLLSIYPNPSDRSVVSVELKSYEPDSDSDTYIEIYSVTGQLVSERYLVKNNAPITVNIDKLPSGVYLVKLFRSGEPVDTSKLIVQ